MAKGNQLNLPWWRSKYILWGVLSFPGLFWLIRWVMGIMDYDNLMHSTGEFSGRFLVFSLIATPLLMLMPQSSFPKWLNRNKRYFGLAAFAYGALHALAYLVEEPSSKLLADLFEISILIAWIAFIIWIPMAITSTDGWVLELKNKWKKIHNWGYLAAILVFAHWALIHYHWRGALVHIAPILILQGYRWIVTWRKT